MAALMDPRPGRMDESDYAVTSQTNDGPRTYHHKDIGAPADMLGSYLDRNSTAAQNYAVLGDANAANNEANRFIAQGQTAQGRVGPQINRVADSVDRQGQLGLVNAYQNAIAGNGPSVARLQANQGMQTNAAMANMTGGRAGILNGAAGMQSVAQQGALGRAGEISGMQGQYGGLLNSMRTADVDRALKQGDLDIAARKRNDDMTSFYENSAQKMRDLDAQGRQGLANAITNAQEIGVQQYMAEEARRRAASEQATNTALGVTGGLLTTAGAVVGGMYGGPMGAAAGATAGGAISNSVKNAAKQ